MFKMEMDTDLYSIWFKGPMLQPDGILRILDFGFNFITVMITIIQHTTVQLYVRY